MRGTIADRELNTKLRLEVADLAHDSGIRKLLRETPMPGSIALTLEREPNYFQGASIAGADDRTILAFSGDQLVCMGRSSERNCWVNGQSTRVGYLAELRLGSGSQGQIRVLREGYQFFKELHPYNSATLCFTSIGTENLRARRLLESGRAGLPDYTFMQELVTVLIAIPRRSTHARLDTEIASRKTLPDLVWLLNDQGRRVQLGAVWTEEILESLTTHGLPLERFLVVRDGGKPVACAGLWDQRGFRQTVIRAYSRGLGAVRPWVNTLSRLIGGPQLPRPDSVLAHAFLSPMAFANGAEAILPDLIEAFFPLARHLGIQFLTLALPNHDPRLPTLQRRFSIRTWSSRLYRVDWPGENQAVLSNDLTSLPEVAFL